MNLDIFGFALEHFRGEKHVGSHIIFNLVIFLVFNEGADSEVNQDCLVIVVYHYIVWLYISVDYLNLFVAVVESFQHVDQVEPYLVLAESHGFDVLTLLLQLLVPFLVGFIFGLDLVS